MCSSIKIELFSWDWVAEAVQRPLNFTRAISNMHLITSVLFSCLEKKWFRLCLAIQKSRRLWTLKISKWTIITIMFNTSYCKTTGASPNVKVCSNKLSNGNGLKLKSTLYLLGLHLGSVLELTYYIDSMQYFLKLVALTMFPYTFCNCRHIPWTPVWTSRTWLFQPHSCYAWANSCSHLCMQHMNFVEHK